MCGIVGFVTTENYTGHKKRDAFLTQGLIVDILRGKDSTGLLYGFDMSARGGYVKDTANGFDFVTGKKYRDVMRDVGKMAYAVGHNRAATLGSVSLANAHPFIEEIGDKEEHCVIGLHNGTVRGNMNYLPINFRESGCVVDSHAIIKNLAHVDPDEAISKVISLIDGAYMLIWHDSRDGSLNMARNNTRSFHIGQSYDQDTLVFASEAGELQWLADRNNLQVAEPLFLKPGNHLKFTEKGGLEPAVREYKPAPKWVTPTSTPAASGGKGGKTPGKYREAWNNSHLNTVMVGGKRQALPQPLASSLKALELAPADRLLFTPLQGIAYAAPKKDPLKYVVGFLDSLGATAVVHKVQPSLLKAAFDVRWTVRPVGVKYTARGRKEPLLICELVAASPTAYEVRTLLPKTGSSETSTEGSGKATEVGVKGPGDSLISTVQWMLQTRGGCVCCGAKVCLTQAADCRWTVGSKPSVQCPRCAQADDDFKAIMDNEQLQFDEEMIH